MKSSLAALVLLATAAAAPHWKVAEPGAPYQFPGDYFSHPDYQTEWWYYTGNLRAKNGHRLGFELTFFRTALDLPKGSETQIAPQWRLDQIYLAHFALSDLDGHEFYHDERINRAGPGIAGASAQGHRVWNGNWHVDWSAQQQQDLGAVTDRVHLRLHLNPEKQVVINGENGIDVKGPLPGEASRYFSFTRLAASGSVELRNQTLQVDGEAWMDHEYFTEPPDNTLAGWDWFSIQLDNHEELMLYRLRRKSGGPDRYSSGTYVEASGKAHHLDSTQFTLTPHGTWRSPESKSEYPTNWTIAVPSLGLTLQESTTLPNQELLSQSGTTPSYWEGAVAYTGVVRQRPVTGQGYLEMTGYGTPVWLGTK